MVKVEIWRFGKKTIRKYPDIKTAVRDLSYDVLNGNCAVHTTSINDQTCDPSLIDHAISARHFAHSSCVASCTRSGAMRDWQTILRSQEC